MRFRTTLFASLIAFLPAAVMPAISQSNSPATPGSTLHNSFFGPHGLLRYAGNTGYRAPVTPASLYFFATVDYPGADGTTVFDENSGGTFVGTFGFASEEQGFTYHAGVYSTVNYPGSTVTVLTGINTAGDIVGAYEDSASVEHGLVDIGGTLTTLDVLAAVGTEALDINDSGQIVGAYSDATTTHGFVDNAGAFTAIDYPGATGTLATGINTAGTIVGGWSNGTTQQSFILKNGVFTDVNYPLSTETTAIGINDMGVVAGYYSDASGVLHGFLYSAGTYNTVDVPGAAATELTRPKKGSLVDGVFIDGKNETHGVYAHH
ncbi:MAG: hypothetical protein WB729_19440 [Candidatus Sulfotelmatobacter sp.]